MTEYLLCTSLVLTAVLVYDVAVSACAVLAHWMDRRGVHLMWLHASVPVVGTLAAVLAALELLQLALNYL